MSLNSMIWFLKPVNIEERLFVIFVTERLLPLPVFTVNPLFYDGFE